MNRIFDYKKEDWLYTGKENDMFVYKYIPGNYFIELPNKIYALNKEHQLTLIRTMKNKI